jgi:7-keto-8-aminopelargonate synthetase-like enzyme
VAKHRSRFRISVSAVHTPELLDQAADTIIDVLRSENIL